jgi:hypothetical protein
MGPQTSEDTRVRVIFDFSQPRSLTHEPDHTPTMLSLRNLIHLGEIPCHLTTRPVPSPLS